MATKTNKEMVTKINKEEEEAVKPNDLNNFLAELSNLETLNNYILKKAKELNTNAPSDPYESEQTNEISAAIAKAQSQYKSIGYNRVNPYLKSSYTDLDAVIQKIRPALTSNNLAITQQTILSDDGATVLKSRVRHASGQWIESRARIVPAKNDAQSYGSSLTYMKRYQILSLLNITIASDLADDDAEIEMTDTRIGAAKGVALNTNYNPRENKFELITKEQLNELEYELSEMPDYVERILDGLKIQSLADMPKSKFQPAINKIRSVKLTRQGRIDNS